MFLAVMILVLMGALGLVALDNATEDRRIAGFQNRSHTAFEAAEAGLAHARQLVLDASTGTPVPLPLTTLGDTALYDRETTRPTYQQDPRVVATNPTGILSVGSANVSGGALGKWQSGLFVLNVEGRSAQNGAGVETRASIVRLEAVQATAPGPDQGAGYERR